MINDTIDVIYFWNKELVKLNKTSDMSSVLKKSLVEPNPPATPPPNKSKTFRIDQQIDGMHKNIRGSIKVVFFN